MVRTQPENAAASALTTRRTALGLTATAAAGLLADRILSPDSAHALEPAEAINVKSFGAKGDGVTDDTLAFQAAGIEAMAAQARLLIPGSPKPYRIHNVQWNFPTETRPLYLEGAGKFKTVIEKIGGDSLPILKLAGSSGSLVNHSILRGLSIRGVAKACPGLVLENSAWLEVDDVDIRSCSTGIAGIGLLTSVLRRLILLGNNEGLSLTKGQVGSNLLTVEHSVISENSNRGLNVDNCPSLRLDHVDIERNGRVGNTATGGLYVGENVTEEYGYGIVSVDGCWFEANNGRALTCASGELRVRESVFLTSDLGTRATNGRDIFVTGKTSRCSIVDSEVLSTVEKMPSIWVDHACAGRIQNSIIGYTSLPQGMQIQEN